MLPLDLHVLSLAFILSQDQTLHCIFFMRCRKFIQLSSSLGIAQASFFDLKVKVWRCNGSALVPRNLVYFNCMFSLSQNAHPVV